jgi:hypothetical protein
MTWTVAAGEVVRQAYLLRGNTLTLALTIYNSTLGGVASGQLFYTIPAGYTSSGLTQGPALAYVPGTGPAPGVGWQTSGQTLVLSRDLASGGAWPVGTGLYYAAVMVFEVQ